MSAVAVNPEERILVRAPTPRDAALTVALLQRAGLQAVVCESFD